jgi:hypothetical protein
MFQFQRSVSKSFLQVVKSRISLYGFRQFSSHNLEKLWGNRIPYYECSAYSLPNIEKSLIERALLGGCLAVLTKSSYNLHQIYETLSDLQVCHD